MLRRLILPMLMLAMTLLTGCTIEPPLHLAPDPEDVVINMPIVITDLDVVWDIDADWRTGWYYGWDEEDERIFGKLEYPMPTNYEVRRYFMGDEPNDRVDQYKAIDGFTVYGQRFRRKYQFGYYNMLLWSNIDSPDGTQTVIINESNPANIIGTTTKTRPGHIGSDNNKERTRVVDTHNQPEIFYVANERNIFISSNIADYDYFDEVENVWVKLLHTELVPVVYIYLVQVVFHNNNGRVLSISDQCGINGLADAVNLHTTVTSDVDANITFDMRMKNDIDCRGEKCDIAGGKLTTFGLCSMQSWRVSRTKPAEVSRLDIDNKLSVCLLVRGGSEVVRTFDITDQIRRQPHGGVITVEVDVDDLDLPDPTGSSGFVPTVEDYEHEEYEFGV